MIARLDALVVAMSVLGGSMLIENSHRVDTGAPDEGLVATSPAQHCENAILEFNARILRKSGHPHKKEDGRYRVTEAKLSADPSRHWIP